MTFSRFMRPTLGGWRLLRTTKMNRTLHRGDGLRLRLGEDDFQRSFLNRRLRFLRPVRSFNERSLRRHSPGEVNSSICEAGGSLARLKASKVTTGTGRIGTDFFGRG